MDDFFKADATAASTPPPQQPDQNQTNDFFAAGTFVCAFKHALHPVFFFPILFRLKTLPFLFSITYARVLFRLRRRNGRICFRATTRYRECRSAIGTEQRRFYSRKRDWHASSTTTDDDNERFERKFPPAATTTTTKSRANGTRDVAREPSFGAFRSFYRSRLGF